uniref:Staphylococcal nuclease domain-containing protein 1 n=1 Tax=Clastoptera arizonana TaxID=38151 RepID=A0A1B6ECM6_9HEMI
MSAPQTQFNRGIVKQITSGDVIVIRGTPKGGPPPEKTLALSNIKAPKLAKRAAQRNEESKDEPFAWEAREFLRKKLIGQEVLFTLEKAQNTTREYGVVYLGKDIATAENINESLVAEGLASVRGSIPEGSKLQELEQKAKDAGKGIHNPEKAQHVRDVKWTFESDKMLHFVDKAAGKPIKAIVEHVRDGSTVRCLLLPDFYYVTIMMTGIRCPSNKLDADGKPDLSVKVDYADEARYFVESRLLQRDVDVVLESVNNNNFVGSILHPKGNIAELLVLEGFARIVDWSMAKLKNGREKLRANETIAKEKKIRIWKNHQPTTPQISEKEKEFSGTVMEVINGEALMIKTANGEMKKIFLASIKPPREQKPGEQSADGGDKLPPRPKNFRPLYDIPLLYEAREFLRKKLIGKKVNVIVDYKQPAKDNFPERICCTVLLNGLNVAEAMVTKGLATVINHRQDDPRSIHYDTLKNAQDKAEKSGKGVFAKKDIPCHRVNDFSADVHKAKQILPHLTRGARLEALVEYVASGSRLRVYIPKESYLITFLLAGISCQRAPRMVPGGGKPVDGDPYGEEALAFTKEKCLQRDVEISVEACDKAGNFIGWLWADNVNLSKALVQEGYASVHSSADRSVYYRELKAAEDSAKARKERIWKNYNPEDEVVKPEQEDKVTERKVDYQKIRIVEVTPELHVFCQSEDDTKLKGFQDKLRQELAVNPPLPGVYKPKKGELCAAKFQVDDQWYRAKIEKLTKTTAIVLYVDYGNVDEINLTDCAALPSGFAQDKYYATEYALAFVSLPKDVDPEDFKETITALRDDTIDRTLNLNVEYKVGNLGYVTLVDASTNVDIVKELVSDGLLLVEKRRDRRLQKLIDEYNAAQDEAKKNRRNIWRYGDITLDED